MTDQPAEVEADAQPEQPDEQPKRYGDPIAAFHAADEVNAGSSDVAEEHPEAPAESPSPVMPEEPQ